MALPRTHRNHSRGGIVEMIEYLKDWKSSGILKKMLENKLFIEWIYYIPDS